LVNRAVEAQFGIPAAGRLLFGQKLVGAPEQQEIVNRAGMGEFYRQYGVPPNFNVSAAAMAPTPEEIAEFRALRNVRVGQLGPPPPPEFLRPGPSGALAPANQQFNPMTVPPELLYLRPDLRPKIAPIQ
jgi:hypothetical protein